MPLPVDEDYDGGNMLPGGTRPPKPPSSTGSNPYSSPLYSEPPPAVYPPSTVPAPPTYSSPAQSTWMAQMIERVKSAQAPTSEEDNPFIPPEKERTPERMADELGMAAGALDPGVQRLLTGVDPTTADRAQLQRPQAQKATAEAQLREILGGMGQPHPDQMMMGYIEAPPFAQDPGGIDRAKGGRTEPLYMPMRPQFRSVGAQSDPGRVTINPDVKLDTSRMNDVGTPRQQRALGWDPETPMDRYRQEMDAWRYRQDRRSWDLQGNSDFPSRGPKADYDVPGPMDILGRGTYSNPVMARPPVDFGEQPRRGGLPARNDYTGRGADAGSANLSGVTSQQLERRFLELANLYGPRYGPVPARALAYAEVYGPHRESWQPPEPTGAQLLDRPRFPEGTAPVAPGPSDKDTAWRNMIQGIVDQAIVQQVQRSPGNEVDLPPRLQDKAPLSARDQVLRAISEGTVPGVQGVPDDATRDEFLRYISQNRGGFELVPGAELPAVDELRAADETREGMFNRWQRNKAIVDANPIEREKGEKKPKHGEVDEMSWEEYQALSPQARAAVDFNTMLVEAVQADRVGRRSGDYRSIGEDERSRYGEAVDSIFGEGGGSGRFAPEVVALLNKLEFEDHSMDLDQFLNLRAAITEKDLRQMDLVMPDQNVQGPTVGYSQLSESEQVKHQLATTLAESTQAMQEEVANGVKLMKEWDSAAVQLALAEEASWFGAGKSLDLTGMKGFGEYQTDSEGSPADGNSYFQLAFDNLANPASGVPAEAVLAEARSILGSTGEFKEFVDYLNVRASDPKAYGAINLGGGEYRTPEEFVQILRQALRHTRPKEKANG